MAPSVVVVRTGWLTTIQDLGRPGLAHLAVPPSGALDRASATLANRLVGNHDGAAVLETTMTGVAVVARDRVLAAVTGAPAELRRAGRAIPFAEPVLLRPGDELDVGPALVGVRSYVAFAGGIDVASVLGSRSFDLLSRLGPPPLCLGQVLPLGAGAGSANVDCGMAPGFTWPGRPCGPVVLRCSLGPRHDRLDQGEIERLATSVLEVAPESDRIGLRLRGVRLRSTGSGELPSEGVVTGAVELFPDGSLVVLLADHPTTGGYPVVAVVEADDLRIAGQLRPGELVRFQLASSSALRLSA